MKSLTADQRDALIEIGNIGMSKAAKQLSILLNSPIKLTIPQISLKSVAELEHEETFHSDEVYSFTSQTITNDLEGVTALMFRREHADILITSFIENTPEFTQEEVRACEQEAMLEIGNIIITSCLSVITHMVSKTLTLSQPIYYEDKIKPLLKKVCLPLITRDKNIFVLSTELKTFNDKLSGYLFVILKEESGTALLESIDQLLKR